MVRSIVGVASRREREGQAGKVEASVEEAAPCVSIHPAVDVATQHMSFPSDQLVLTPQRGRMTHDPAQAVSGLDNNLEKSPSKLGTTSWHFYSHL